MDNMITWKMSDLNTNSPPSYMSPDSKQTLAVIYES
jgi:hypothetical protein